MKNYLEQREKKMVGRALAPPGRSDAEAWAKGRAYEEERLGRQSPEFTDLIEAVRSLTVRVGILERKAIAVAPEGPRRRRNVA